MIYAFVYPSTESEGKTVRTVKINVNKRPKPSNYVQPDTKDYLMRLLNEVEKLIANHDEQIAGNNVSGYGIFLTNSELVSYRWDSVIEETDGVYKWIVPPNVGISYIRVTGRTTDGSTLIVTVNEEITD